MATISYITPITNRTQADVEYARQNQHDLVNKHIGAWNYTDLNRICNNLKYAAEYMHEQGFLSTPYEMQIKTDWTENDIITYETLNTMIVQNMNNLKTYSRPDLTWYPISSIVNMDYGLANWIERNIHMMATQVPMPPDKYTLTVENGTGSGEYEPTTIVSIQANPAEEGMIFSHWSGDHLEYIGSATAMITTYRMPYENVKLTANYTSAVPHTLTVITHTSTTTHMLSMGEIHYIEADPAPQDKVFHHWEVTPSIYENKLYEPAATTHFTMPNEAVTLKAIYITRGEKQLKVEYGKGSGYYDYGTYVAVSSDKPEGATFSKWTGDTQYLTSPVTQEFNSVLIPDVNVIKIRANWINPPIINLTVENGVITSTGGTSGKFSEGSRINIKANPAPAGMVFFYWEHSGGGYVSNSNSSSTSVVIGDKDATVKAVYRYLEYYTLTVTTNSGTTTTTKEKYDYFSVDANPIPSGYTFNYWSGDTHTFNQYSWEGFDTSDPTTGTYMGGSNRTIVANYRVLNLHTLTVKQRSGDLIYQQEELTTVTVTAEDAPKGMRFVRWEVSGAGTIPGSQETSKTVTYTFGNGDGILTPIYVNVWTITVENGTIDGKTTAVLDEGSSYRLRCRELLHYEGFGSWTQNGPGSISNTASTSTYFTVGTGDATLTANIIEYPDKTLTVYWRHPDTNIDTLQFRKTYKYGTKITGIEAEIAPNKSTFLTWLGDVNPLSPSALASTVTINSLTTDVTIIATYFYPESPEYYTLTVYDGYPYPPKEYAAGSQVPIKAKDPSQGWEFYTWYGDIQYLVNQEGLQEPENSVIMPKKAITLYAKFKEVGELALWTVSVSNGIAKATYFVEEAPEEGEEDTREAVTVEGTSIFVPEGTEVILVADEDTVGYKFDRWEGNFDAAGVTDIVKTDRETRFTMPKADMNIQMVRAPKDKCIIYPKNATAPNEGYVGNTYSIMGNLQDNDDYKYTFEGWSCVDADGNSYIQCIKDPSETGLITEITIPEEESLWLTAEYTTKYKLTVVKGQNADETSYYAENEIITSVYADTPTEESRLQFDHWDDPMGIVKNIYDKTPTIIMKNTIATITAVFTSIDATGNSVIMTGDDIHDELIYRTDSYLINGVYSTGALVFDKDGCLGILTKVDPDESDDTDDFEVKKFFYGGNF